MKIESSTAIFGGLGIAAIAAAAFFLVREVRGAGQDLSESITKGVLSGVGESLSGITADIQGAFSDFKFPEFDFGNIFGQDTSSSIAGETIVQDDGSVITIPESTVIDPSTGIVTSDTPPLLDLSDVAREEALTQLELNRQRSILEQELFEIPASEDISGAEFASARNESEFRARQQEQIVIQEAIAIQPARTVQPVESLLPSEQEFLGGGPSFVSGTIFENPIDTFVEVFKFFPELSAGQIQDFLRETGGTLLPSQVGLIDPDIKNIVASVQGENIQVENVSISDLDFEEAKSSCTTCGLFGLNCEKCTVEAMEAIS